MAGKKALMLLGPIIGFGLIIFIYYNLFSVSKQVAIALIIMISILLSWPVLSKLYVVVSERSLKWMWNFLCRYKITCLIIFATGSCVVYVWAIIYTSSKRLSVLHQANSTAMEVCIKETALSEVNVIPLNETCSLNQTCCKADSDCLSNKNETLLCCDDNWQLLDSFCVGLKDEPDFLFDLPLAFTIFTVAVLTDFLELIFALCYHNVYFNRMIWEEENEGYTYRYFFKGIEIAINTVLPGLGKIEFRGRTIEELNKETGSRVSTG